VIQRVLAAFAVIAVIVAGWLVLEREQSGVARTAQQAPAAVNPGYSASNAEIIETGTDGLRLYTLRADTIHQLPDDQMVALEGVRLELKDDAGNLWNASATHGQILEDAALVDLVGDVLIAGMLPGSDQPAHITTEHLSLDTRTDIATTKDIVHFDWAGHHMRTHGLTTSLKDHHLKLESDVHGTFHP